MSQQQQSAPEGTPAAAWEAAQQQQQQQQQQQGVPPAHERTGFVPGVPIPPVAKNHIRISLTKNKFTYVDLAKYLLHEGEQTVELSGMGDAIANVVEIAEILKAQGAISIIEVETNRAPERPGGIQVDRIKVKISKTEGFEEIFAQQQEEKAKRKQVESEQQGGLVLEGEQQPQMETQ